MKRELVDDIYKRLLNEDWKDLPPYLKGGQMEMCMFIGWKNWNSMGDEIFI